MSAKTRGKVVVAMSGGVDSSVAACLLVEQGYEVTGLFMRVGAKHPSDTRSGGDQPRRLRQGCCSATDADDARFVAGMLDIRFYALNFEEDFDRIIDYFADEYARGRTPNPCIVCNDRLKFGKIFDYADMIGARYVATGHYARIGDVEGGKALLCAHDQHKDQTYVLFGLDRAALERVLFPLGELTKEEVRTLAATYGLPNKDKPDSVEICFVPDQDYVRVVRERRPEALMAGDVVNAEGRVLGRHKGIARFTVGQRRGLGIATGSPLYVTELNVGRNTVRVGENRELLCRSLIASRVKYLIDPPHDRFRGHAKIRYLHTAAPATIQPLAGGAVRVLFDEPQRAVAPGQAVVFYGGDRVLGGAWIDRPEPVQATEPVSACATAD